MLVQRLRIRFVIHSALVAKVSCTCLIVIVLFHSQNLHAGSSDQIGPDPIQSENCLIITPGHSLVCRGRSPNPNSVYKPTLTINCDAGVFVLITHEEVADKTFVRQVTLETNIGTLTQQWLAPSEIQSAVLLFFRGSNDSEYAAILRFIGSLLQPDTSEFRFLINDGAVAGTFAFTYSDRKLLEQIAPSCG